MKEETKEEVTKRLNITAGHIRKISDMVEEDRYCVDIIQQTEAVKGALKRIEEIILDSHLRTCVVPAFKGKRAEKSIKELVEVFKRG